MYTGVVERTASIRGQAIRLRSLFESLSYRSETAMGLHVLEIALSPGKTPSELLCFSLKNAIAAYNEVQRNRVPLGE